MDLYNFLQNNIRNINAVGISTGWRKCRKGERPIRCFASCDTKYHSPNVRGQEFASLPKTLVKQKQEYGKD